jgi:indolepyruvate ferredoxin oxidoreductase alpha subunit
VAVIKPYRVNKSIEALKEAIDFKGVSVIISKEACTLYAQSLKKARGKPFYISEKCKNHRDCVNELACPAFYTEGEKVYINADLCTGCAVCAQICPEKAIVPVRSKEKASSS